MIFPSCKEFNFGDSGEGINPRAPRGLGGALNKEEEKAVGSCCSWLLLCNEKLEIAC